MLFGIQQKLIPIKNCQTNHTDMERKAKLLHDDLFQAVYANTAQK